MNIEQARFNMVEQQVRTWEVLDPGVLELLYAVPREAFVPPAYRKLAFADMEMPLGEGESMMAPKMEARIVQELALRKTDRVLEVGTGSGYLTALLARCAAHVYSLEIRPALAAFGRDNLSRHGAANVTLDLADGACGDAKRAPYDAIVLTGSTPVLPAGLKEQLSPGGRLFAVVGEAPVMVARLITCTAPGAFGTVDLFDTVIAPLVNAERAPRFRF